MTLVQKSAVEALDRAIKAAYRAKYNVEATTFFTVPGQGAGTVDLHAREEPQRSTLMIISLSKTKGNAPLTRLALSEEGMSNGRSPLAALGCNSAGVVVVAAVTAGALILARRSGGMVGTYPSATLARSAKRDSRAWVTVVSVQGKKR